MSLRVAFIGPPNVGKSSLFSRVSGIYAPVGNWAGMTVEAHQAKVLWCGQLLTLYDLPGFYQLKGGSEDELVAQRLLASTSVDLCLLVLDAVQLPKQIPLLEALLQRQQPLVVLINQIDEAERLGIFVDTVALSTDLGVPVLAVSGRTGQGVDAIQAQVCRYQKQASLTQPAKSIFSLSTHIDRYWRLPSLLGDGASERLDAILLHPLWGLPIFALVMVVLFQVIFWLGGSIQDWVSDGFAWVGEHGLTPLLSSLPHWLSSLLIDGVYNGVATLISFVPLVGLFFFLLASLNDSGYLVRMAFLADNLMARFGLEGRSLVLTVMAMGCNVPAILGARIIPDRRSRWLTQLMIPFALCSARLQVFVFIAAALFAPWQAAFVVLGLYALSVLASLLTAWIGQKAFKPIQLYPVVLEMPAYRIPHWTMAWQAAWHEVRIFLHRASTLIILGVVAVWSLLNLPVGVQEGSVDSYAAQLAHWLSPIFDPIGLPQLYVVALLFGFIAKEVVLGGLMILLGVNDVGLSTALAQSLTPSSALSLMVFTLLYTPCLASLSALKQEGGWRLMMTSLIWSLVFAWVMAAITYHGAVMLGGL